MNARMLIVIGALSGALLPRSLLATTLASGSATSEFVLTFSNFDPANEFGYPYCLGGVGLNRQTGPLTAGRGIASGSANIPEPTCTVLQDGWQVTVLPRSFEGAAGLELDFALHAPRWTGSPAIRAGLPRRGGHVHVCRTGWTRGVRR